MSRGAEVRGTQVCHACLVIGGKIERFLLQRGTEYFNTLEAEISGAYREAVL
jgi:hypothetical protein